jgi:hypothetical protein
MKHRLGGWRQECCQRRRVWIRVNEQVKNAL